MTLNIFSATQCDKVLADFLAFYQNKLKHAKLNCGKFEKDKDRLDDFYVKESSVLPSKELFILILLSKLS